MSSVGLDSPVKDKDSHTSSDPLSPLLKKLSEKTHYLTELLPYDLSIKTGKRLLDGLKELLLLFKAFELTIQALEKNELKSFDPLVGENACQIRAVKLAMILSNCCFDWTELSKQIRQKKQVIEKLFLDPSLIQSGLSLKDIINYDKLDIQVTQIELFLIKSYLLSKVKVLKPEREEHPLVKNEYTDTKKIKEISNVGSMFADNLVTNLREKLSLSSILFVQMASLETKEQNIEMLSNEFIFDHRGLKCLPCYWTNRILMQQTINYKIPIVMIAEQKIKDRNYEVVEKTVIFFKKTPSGYSPTTKCEFHPSQPALVLYGSTCKQLDEILNEKQWKEELIKYCPIDILLAYAAVHRQYPNDTQESLFEQLQDSNYQYHKSKAFEWGCSADNPSRFFLAHAFCDTIGNIKNL